MKKVVFVLLFIGISLFAKIYNKTSFYIAYDNNDPTQYALIMPAVKKVYTHKAGHIKPSDLTDITKQFGGKFPTYNNGEVCFPSLTSDADGSNGAKIMAGKCYECKFFYIQKEYVENKGYAFMLYYKPGNKLYEGLAGKPETFEVVMDKKGVYNNKSITGEDYTYFKFDLKNAKILLGKDALSSSSEESILFPPQPLNVEGDSTSSSSELVFPPSPPTFQ